MAELVSLLIGVVMPLLVELINRFVKADKRVIRYAVAFLSSVLVGGATTVFVENTDFTDWDDLLANVGLVFAASQTVYNTFWKDSVVQKMLAGNK